MRIIDIHGNPIDEVWAAEFRGFFFGDGFLGIVRNGKSIATGEPQYTPRAQITLRDDDAKILIAIAAKLGGYISREPRRDPAGAGRIPRNPSIVWRSRNYIEVTRVCDLLEGARLPSKKIAEIDVMREFLTLRIPHGKRDSTTDFRGIMVKRLALLQKMQSLHAYQL